MKAILAQIQIDMQELCTHDDIVRDHLFNHIYWLQADYTDQLGTQRRLVDHLAFQVSGIAWYLRDNPKSAAATASTPPTFNPPPIVIPGSSIFPEFGSISTLHHSITNNIFTPDVFSTHPRPSSDGSLVTKHKAPTSTPSSTINPVPTMGQSGSLADLAGALPVLLPTVVMESMPSASTICTSLTGPSNVLADGHKKTSFDAAQHPAVPCSISEVFLEFLELHDIFLKRTCLSFDLQKYFSDTCCHLVTWEYFWIKGDRKWLLFRVLQYES
ncbi:hypothetical protein BDR04DRAFT_1118267 [Suillus decipiens]|nr:hypothetical protein BDR04DRAFT_1118267 [Suillus decipiens]